MTKVKEKLKVIVAMEKHCRETLYFLGIFSLIIMPVLVVVFGGDKCSLYIISFALFGIAIPTTYLWSLCLHTHINNKFPKEREENKDKTERIPWIPLTIGIFERAFISMLIGYNISGSAAFLGAWVTIKAIGGWSDISKGKPYGRSIFFIGLLGSIMSLWFAVIIGLYIKKLVAL